MHATLITRSPACQALVAVILITAQRVRARGSRSTGVSVFMDGVGQMDVKEIVAAVNAELRLYGRHELVLDSGADLRAAAGTLDGVPVRLQVTSVPGNPSQYRYEVWLFDATTDHLAGRGNGGPSIPDAISAYQWKDALAQLELPTT